MKFIKLATGSINKFHMKWPQMEDPLFLYNVYILWSFLYIIYIIMFEHNIFGVHL